MSCTQSKPIDNYMEMHINHLADFMFLKNTNNTIIELELNGVEDNKDLFFFLVDLFCKGLVLLFGTDNKVEVGNLSMEDFNTVKQKMALAGVDVNLLITEITSDEENELAEEADTRAQYKDTDVDAPNDIEPANKYVNLNDLEKEPNDKALSEYIFKLKQQKVIYNINFTLLFR